MRLSKTVSSDTPSLDSFTRYPASAPASAQEDFLKIQNDLYDQRLREIEQEDRASLWFAIGATGLTALLILGCAAYLFWPGRDPWTSSARHRIKKPHQQTHKPHQVSPKSASLESRPKG